jgi:hypothetical protein
MIEFLIWCQLKHWLVDFRLQTNEMVRGKAIYGNLYGLLHSFQHGILTLYIASLFTSLSTALLVAGFDFITHYHIDWIKMNYGNRDIQSPQFWSHLGLDQMAHQIVYLFIAKYIFV